MSDGVHPAEAALRARFALRSETFAHAGVRLDVLLPASADALIDEAEFERDERLPYWADLWPSARALARRLLDAPHAPPTLELGAGVALPSLALLARGAAPLATDYYDDALDFARANARRNALTPLETRLLDWRDVPRDLARWPRVVAADVLYEQRNVAPLLATLDRLVEPGGTALVADPGRVYLTEFRQAAAAAGWRLEERVLPEPTGYAARGTIDVRLLELRRG